MSNSQPPSASASASAAFDPSNPDYANTPVSPRRPVRAYRPADLAAPPVVSIVTPYFDAGEVFHETVRSVFSQSLQQWEWILVDDGSTDAASLARLAEVAARDPRLRVVRHAGNRGLSAARNTGFREARAELVFQLDADDLIEPTALEKLAWHLTTRPESGFAGGITVGFGAKEYVWRHGFHEGPAFLEENLVTATKLVRRSVHREVGGYDEANRAGLEDWAFWLAAAARGHWGTTLEEVMDWYRRRDSGREQWTNVLEAERTRAFRDALKQRHPRLLERFPQLAPGPRPFISLDEAPLPFANALAAGPRRLLFVVPHFELGGADKFNLDVIRALQREHGWEVTVVATRCADHAWQPAFAGLTPDVFALSSFLEVADHARFLRYLVGSRRPQAVLLSNSLAGYQLAPYLRAHFPTLPLVDYVHMEEEGWGAGGYPRCSVDVASQLTASLVSSHHLKAWMTARGRAPDEVEVIHTAIDGAEWKRDAAAAARAAARFGVDRSRPVILHAARICSQKQPRVLAEVLKRVAQAEPRFTALIAGDGPDHAWLADFVAREGLSQVRLLGSVPNAEVRGLLSLADVFFLPSLWEGISLALYEAMAMGAVPVSARVGGQAELVVPGTGVLVEPGPGEIDAYTAALISLLRDPAGRSRTAAAARARVAESFPIAEMGRRMDAALRGATERARLRQDRVLPLEWAPLVAWMSAEQLRASDSADTQYKEAEAARRQAVQATAWMAPAAAARLLLERGHRPEAMEAYDQAVAAVAGLAEPCAALEARRALARELIPLDPLRAAAALEGGVSLIGSPVARRMTAELVAKLRATAPPAPAAAPGPGAAPGGAAEPPTVTVVIPCYKQAHYLPEAVQSVAAQTHQAWEIVVVDDGSPDDTAAVAGRLAAQHGADRVRLVRQENRGLPAARNAGFRAARGRYVLPLDADDKIKPALLARLFDVLERNPGVGFAYAEIEHFGTRDDVYPLPDFDRAALYRDNIACVCSLVRRAAWEQVGGYDESMREGYEDWNFWITLAEAGWEGHCTHLPLFLYRKAGESMLSEANRKRERLLATIVSKHPRIYDEPTQAWSREVLARHLAPPAGPTATAPAIPPLGHAAGPAPKVSVIIPCYRQAELLPLAVASVVAQTCQDWELIVVDDGSPDQTAEVARQLFEQLPGRSCRLLRQANAGLAAARNAGVAEARGAYVLPLDADDAIAPTYLEKAVAVLDGRPDVHIVATDGITFGSREERILQDPPARWPRVHLENCLFYCALYRRESWAAVGGYNPNMTMGYEDWDFWVACREAGLAVAHVREPLFYYRVKAESMFTRAQRYDHQLRARMVLNHPRAFPPDERERAARLLEREPLPAHGQAVPSAPPPPPARPVAGTAAAAAP